MLSIVDSIAELIAELRYSLLSENADVNVQSLNKSAFLALVGSPSTASALADKIELTSNESAASPRVPNDAVDDRTYDDALNSPSFGIAMSVGLSLFHS